jgi:hypothetical protein
MTAQSTLGGLDVLGGVFTQPLSGISTGTLELSGDALAIGPTSLSIAGDGVPATLFAVCVSNVALVEGRILASIVGGRTGGLSRSSLGVDVAALHYDGDPTPVTAWELLSDLVSLAGESLDSAPRAALEALSVASWLRPSGAASRALAGITGQWGLSARFSPIGDLWVGVDTWLQSIETPVSVDPIDDGWALHMAPRGGGFAPGTMLGDKRIRRVDLIFGEALRALLHYREAA